MTRRLPIVATALLMLRCGGAPGGEAQTADVRGARPDAPVAPPSTGVDAGQADAPAAAPIACDADAVVTQIRACIDAGKGPRACLADARAAFPAPSSAPCDADGDALDDALEGAMLTGYAPVFAYNQGDGSHTAGDSEPMWPINAAHFVEHSTLAWRVDGDTSTTRTVDAAPQLATMRDAVFVDGTVRRADSPVLGQGPNFWLCLRQENGAYAPETLVESMDASRALPGGIDLFSVAHPTGASADGRYVVLEYMLLYAYNAFTLDDHEGDFEGGAVFVDLDTGDVVAAYTDRHATADGTTLLPLTGPGALPAKDPSAEAPHYDVCDDTAASPIGGVRFWDYATLRHHPVFYPAAGGHASYAYPGATKIQGLGCFEATMIRDVHNGEGPKLVPFESAYYTDWGTTKRAVTSGVHVVNLGEEKKLRAAWSAFKGQWGCTLDTIPKSYPGPWDNQRLCRHWLTNDWGDAPPFTRSTQTSCID